MSKEAMTLALEALTAIDGAMPFPVGKRAIKTLEEALSKQEGQSNFCPQCEALACELKAIKQEQGEPVAYIHRNEYNEYRLEPHDNFDIKSISVNVDVPLFKELQPAQKPMTDEQIEACLHHVDEDGIGLFAFARAIEAAHGIKE